MNEQIDKLFGGRVRVRACGLYWEAEKLLLANHEGLSSGNFWAPPGGAVEFGQSVREALKREFVEETGLTIEPGEFRFAGEFIKEPLHAIELYFDVNRLSGEVRIGSDPEMPEGHQMITDIKFMNFSEIMGLPKEERHALFDLFPTEKSLKLASGYWKI